MISAATCVLLCLSGVVNILLVALRWVILNNKTLCERDEKAERVLLRKPQKERERSHFPNQDQMVSFSLTCLREREEERELKREEEFEKEEECSSTQALCQLTDSSERRDWPAVNRLQWNRDWQQQRSNPAHQQIS